MRMAKASRSVQRVFTGITLLICVILSEAKNLTTDTPAMCKPCEALRFAQGDRPGTAGSTPEQINRLELLAEDRRRVETKPSLEDRGVNLAEIGVMARRAVVE